MIAFTLIVKCRILFPMNHNLLSTLILEELLTIVLETKFYCSKNIKILSSIKINMWFFYFTYYKLLHANSNEFFDFN